MILGMEQVALFVLVLTLLAWPLGKYMAWVYSGKLSACVGVCGWLEQRFYKLARIRQAEDMDWQRYAISVLLFNGLGFLAVYAIQRLQNYLPFNPQGFAAVTPDLAFNTAASFATNTNWQSYGGETTMSHGTQMLALTVQNFVSAATGMAVLLPLIRGFVRECTDKLGNFWVDLTRGTLYILMPLAVALALVLVAQGTPQTLAGPRTVATLEGSAPAAAGQENVIREQVLPLGPAASQISIKQLGTNGGGFYNVNSAHPFENPTPLTNFLEMIAILLVSAGLCFTFGDMVGDMRQGWAIYAAMLILLLLAFAGCWWAESTANPALTRLGVDAAAGNMEGKEARFGVVGSVLWATVTTAASNGSVNSMHDSFMPLGGMVPMFLMQLGEVVFGGTGSGLYGMLVFVILTVFIAGLMVGRTPEYLGKKIGIFEMQMAVLVILLPPLLVLGATAVAVLTPAAAGAVANPGPHGFSEMLYAFSSMGNNNGSAFAGLSANQPFYNYLGGVVMLMARFWLVLPVLALAAALAQKKRVPASAGTLPTHGPLFVLLLMGVVLLVGVLTFLPAMALGPIAEHCLMVW